MKDYSGSSLCDVDFNIIRIIENIIGESIPFYSFYSNGNIDGIDGFNAFYAENGHILHLILTLSISRVPEDLSRLKNLEVLSLEGNEETSLPISLGDLSKLKDLSLHQFNLEFIPKSIGNLKNLKVLRFSKFRKIQFPKQMRDLNSLEIFGLYESKLESIPEFLLNLERLKEFDLWSCTIKRNEKSTNILKQLQEQGVKIREPKWI